MSKNAMKEVYVIGGGLAGLAAAIDLADAGVKVTLFEAGPACGGRCRSYFDRELGMRIDNGNHLLLSGNHAAFGFLAKLGTGKTLKSPKNPIFPFFDLATGESWILRPSLGRVPFWLANRKNRVPGTKISDYLALLHLWAAGPDATITQTLPQNRLFSHLIAPLAISVLNTPVASGSAQLLFAVIRETLLAGGKATIPAFPEAGLSESFIDPAIAYLTACGATIRTSYRVSTLAVENQQVISLGLPDGEIKLPQNAKIVLATPAQITANLLPGIIAPTEFEAILNVHFTYDLAPTEAGFVGVINGLTEWIFIKPGIISVTVSAANAVIDQDSDQLAAQIWPEICRALGFNAATPIPKYRVVKEKRATFAATPAMAKLRAGVAAGPQNLALAGDWTATGLPATIEGAIRSGQRAAQYVLAR